MNSASISSIEQQLQQITNLISLPEIYLKVRSLMDDPTSDIYDFSEVIQFDSNLTVSVLKMVNSAYFGFPDKIESVSQAVNMIGIGQLHSMVLGVSAMSSLDFPNDIMPLKTFWRCSIFAGVLSRLLARQLKIRQGERLFIMGMLHEIGHLVLYAKFPEQAKQAVQLSQSEHISIDSAEKQILGLHYGEIGAMLMKHWGLSDEFQTATRTQPNPQTATNDLIDIGILHLAHGYAHQVVVNADVAAEELINPVAWEMTQLSPQDIDNTLENARTVSAEMERVIKV